MKAAASICSKALPSRCRPGGCCGKQRWRAASQRRARQVSRPFVGRVQEMGLLLDRWRLAQQGEGQAVLLTGEPGMGKSRLIEALFERVGSEPHRRIVTQCSPYHSNTAFYPVMRQIEQAAGFVLEDSAAQKLDKLDALLAKTGTPPFAMAPLLADLLSLPAERPLPAARAHAGTAQERDGFGFGRSHSPSFRARTGVVRPRGCSLDRSDNAGIDDPPYRIPSRRHASARHRHRASGIRFAMGGARSRCFARAQPPRQDAVRRDRRRNRGGAFARTGCCSKKFWHKTDGVPLFVEELTKAIAESPTLNARGAGDVAGFTDGAARSARPRQGDRADRRRDRAAICSGAAGRRRADWGRRTRHGACAIVGSRTGVSAKPRDRAELQFQARTDARCGLRQLVASAPAAAPRAHRAHARKAISGVGGGGAGNPGASFQPGWPRWAGVYVLRACGRSRRHALGLCRGGRAFHCRDWQKRAACQREASATGASLRPCSSKDRPFLSTRACGVLKSSKSINALMTSPRHCVMNMDCSRPCGDCGSAPT